MKKRVVLIGCVLIVMSILHGCGNNQTEKLDKGEEVSKEKQVKEADKAKLTALTDSIKRLYADDSYTYPAKELDQDDIDKAFEALKEVKAERYLTNQQMRVIDKAEKDLVSAEDMLMVVRAMDLFFTEKMEFSIAEVKEQLEQLKDRTQFYEEFRIRVQDIEEQLEHMERVKTSVFQIWNVEQGVMEEGVTRRQFYDVKAAVETIPDGNLKTELIAMIDAVDRTLTELEESSKTEEVKRDSGKGNSSEGVGYSDNEAASNKPASSSNPASSQNGADGTNNGTGSLGEGGSVSSNQANGIYQGETEGGSSYGGDLSEEWFQ